MSVFTLCALLTLAAEPATSAPPKLALSSISAVGIEPQLATFYAEHLANQMKLEGVEVITQGEIASLMGVERQRQLLGCTEQSTDCMLELSSALGVDALVLGGFAKVGAGTQVNLKVVRNSGKTLAVFSELVASSDEVIPTLNRAARQLSTQTAAAMGRTLNPSALRPELSAPGGGGIKKWWWAPAASGVAVAAVGTVLLISASGSAAALEDTSKGPLPYETAKSIAGSGATQQTIGGALVAVGAAGVAAGLAMLVFGKSGETSVAIIPSANPSLVVGGTF